MKTRPASTTIRAALAVAVALLAASPAAADAVRWRRLDAPVSAKLASAFSTSFAGDNLKRTGDLTLESWWGNDSSWNRYSYVLNNPLKLVDPDGRTAFVFTVGPGNGLFEKFGHSAAFVAHPSGDSAGISLGGSHGFENGIGQFIRDYNAEGRTVLMTILDTSPEQDAQMIGFIRSDASAGIDRDAPGAGLMIRENCAQGCGNVLEAGGVVPQGSDPSQILGGALSTPAALLDAVLDLEIPSATVTLAPDASQDRENFLQLLDGIGGGQDAPDQ